MILIFSRQFDYSTSCVVRWLDYYGVKTIRLNGDDDTYKFISLTADAIYLRNTITDEIIDIKKDLQACWWRRSGIRKSHLCSPVRESRIADGVDLTPLINGSSKGKYLDKESEELLDYISYNIYQASPINLGSPDKFNLNRLKILDIAKRHGLNIPVYKIVTDGKQLVESNRNIGEMVTKAIANGIYTEIQNHRYYTYTELIDPLFYEENESNTFFPSLVTGLIEKTIEIRAFYMAGVFYSMAIFSQSDEQTKIDFRKYTNNRREPFVLPKDIETKLKKVFNELGLNTGSADLIVNTEGEYVFLEINPVGQFDMTSRPCNYNLHKKVANYLIYGN